MAKRENAVILYEDNYQQHYEGFDPNSPESNILFELIQDKNMENSIQLAKFMQKNICAATHRQDKGVQQDNLAVLRLMELGFISTLDEEQYMNSDLALQQYTRGFYNAFVAYKNKVAPGIKVPYKPAPAEPVDRPAPATPAAPENPAAPETPATPESAESSAPIFKVQILASSVRLKAGSQQLKGVADTDCYEEGGMYKYTVGASENYAEIYQLRKQLADRFPQAFIIAFKDGKKVNVNEAIREYKANKNKK